MDEHTYPETKINIHHILPVSEVNGPGKRSVIWVQGCVFRCKGCFNKELLPFIPQRLMTPESVIEELPLSGIEGVTISGGEPFCQAEPLSFLAQAVKEAGLTLMVYTGYTYEVLMESENPFTKGLLSAIDILVDGPYKEQCLPDTTWAGSGNQHIHFLTDTYVHYREKIKEKYRYSEIHISADGEIKATGFIH